MLMNWSPMSMNALRSLRPRRLKSKILPYQSSASSMSPTSIATWLMPISLGFFPSLISILLVLRMPAVYEPHSRAPRKRSKESPQRHRGHREKQDRGPLARIAGGTPALQKGLSSQEAQRRSNPLPRKHGRQEIASLCSQ